MPRPFVFDLPMQSEVRQAKIEFLHRVIPAWKDKMPLRTALDLGCGVGYFSEVLRDLGLQVTAVDAREENITEARRRHADVDFRVADAEDPALPALGSFDLVLCFGLLYHLENPMRAIRNCRALANKVALLESMCVPNEQPILILLDEPAGEDQSVDSISCYPSEAAIVKMFYRAGFPSVCRFNEMPDHEDFRSVVGRAQTRTMIGAFMTQPTSPSMEIVTEPRASRDLWTTDPTGITKAVRRLRRNLGRPKKRP